MMELGHEYEDISKFQQGCVANPHSMSEDYDYVSDSHSKGMVNPQEVDEEYAVIANTTVEQYESISAKSQPTTQCTDLQLSPASKSSHLPSIPKPASASQLPLLVSESSHPPQAPGTEAKSSSDTFEFTECVAYETTVHAPPPASISSPLYSN